MKAVFKSLGLALACISAPALANPDPAACPEPDDIADSVQSDGGTVELPDAFREVAATDGKNLAVATLAETTICEPVHWMVELRNPAFLTTERFLGMRWFGMEADGYLLFDRAGTGSVTDTGRRPVFSKGMHRMASIQFTGAGWGGLESFVVWTVTESGLKELYRLNAASLETPNITDYIDLRIDSFVGQGCVHISGITQEDYARAERPDLAARTEFFAREDQGWKIVEGYSTGCLDG